MPKISLKEYAQQEGIHYSKAYRQFKRGQIANAIMEKGDIFVNRPNIVNSAHVYHTSLASEGRKNRSSDGVPDDNYNNINQLLAPYFTSSSSKTTNDSVLDAQTMLSLCQKAYYGVSDVRRVIDTLQEFSTSRIFFEGSNKKSRQFFEDYYKAINLEGFQRKFFTEYWRSGNVFIHKLVGKIKYNDLQSFKKYSESVAGRISLPVQYIILNPVDIVFQSSAFFSSGRYAKRLNAYEVARLKNPQTDHEKQIYNALPDEAKAQIGRSKYGGATVIVDLKAEDSIAIFNNKQDYESFAVSIIYPVLDDIDFKIELKKMDRAIAKTCQQAVLHISLGYEDKQGNYHFPEEAAARIEEIFENEEIGRVLITDFTAKVNFVLPQISDLLDPKKYEVVNRDINEGLMDVIFGGGGSGEKFSNLSAKIKVFVEKVRKARQAFLTEFLIPEMELVAKSMGFKSIPSVKFEDIDIEDNVNFYRIVARLGEVGFLTPQEVFNAFDSGKLPNQEESEEAQKHFKELKDQGFYRPIADNTKEMEGRPPGTTSPQTTKTVTPVGDSKAWSKLTCDKLKSSFAAELSLMNSITNLFKTKFNVKKLNQNQAQLAHQLTQEIMMNEKMSDWQSKIEPYLNNNYTNTDQKDLIHKFATENNLSLNTAIIVFHASN